MQEFIYGKKNNKAILFTLFITSAHIIVFLLLKTVFNDVISDHSVNAMTFRSVAWVVITVIVWKGIPKVKEIID